MNTLWHGGRNLKFNYRDITPAKGLWEHGPGLYLTTSYLRARSYAKGGGTTYKVSVEEGRDISETMISLEHIQDFIKSSIIASKRKELLEDVEAHIERRLKADADMLDKRAENKSNTPRNTHRTPVTDKCIKAEYFLNLVINLEAIKKSNTDKLCIFLVENGVDYGFTNNYGGSGETVMVVYNRQKIKKVEEVAARDVMLDDYTLPINSKSCENNCADKSLQPNHQKIGLRK